MASPYAMGDFHLLFLATSREGRREAFTGETTGQVLSCETGLIPRCRSYSEKEKATSSHGERLAWEEPRAVGDLVHVETFFARKLGGLIHARTRVPGRLVKATSRTPSMYVDEKSDEAIVCAKRLNKGRQLPAEVVEGRASPKGNSR